MTELKTLKDIEINDKLFQLAQAEKSNNQIIVAKNKLHPEGDFIPLIKPIVLSHELRQELGIKWIKSMREKNKKAKTIYDKQEVIWNEILITWIKHIFNITEEDLK